MSSRIEFNPTRVITREQADRIRDHAERIVTASVIIAGLLPTPAAGSIRIDKPVNLPDGRAKNVHHWDLTVFHPKDPDLYYFVEVCNGNAKTPAKQAQLEVVKRAGVENHMLITADIWTFLEKKSYRPRVNHCRLERAYRQELVTEFPAYLTHNYRVRLDLGF